MKQPTVSLVIVMNTPLFDLHANSGPDRRKGNDLVTQTVQELLHVAALANHRNGAAVYFPETFLTRW